MGNLTRPLSNIEKRLRTASLMDEGWATYNQPMTFQLKGNLDLAQLEKALQSLTEIHPELRSTYLEKEVRVEEKVVLPLIKKDFHHISDEKARLQEAIRFMEKEAREPIDLLSPPLMRAHLADLGGNSWILQLNWHHLIVDGHSISVFLQQLSDLYNDRPIEKNQLGTETETISCELNESLDYWKKTLEGAHFSLELPKTSETPNDNHRKGSFVNTVLDPELSKQFLAYSQEKKNTPFRCMMAAFSALLYRYTGQEDFIIGYPIDLRKNAEEKSLGLFINNLPMRFSCDSKTSYSDLLTQVSQARRSSKAHQACPFEEIARVMGSEVVHLRQPLFNVSFELENFSAEFLDLEDIFCEELIVDTQTAKFDLSLKAYVEKSGVRLYFEYATGLFSKEFIERMVKNFRILLKGLLDHPEESISKQPLLTEEEHYQVLTLGQGALSNYPRDSHVVELFEKQVKDAGSREALHSSEKSLKYEELNLKANRLARYLQSLGVKKGDFVGISLLRSVDLIVGILGIVKAGAAYVPIDESYPPERKQYMLEDSKIEVLLTQQSLESSFSGVSKIVTLDKTDPSWETLSSENLGVSLLPEDKLCMNYTSGSTGKPKGVAILHRGAVRLVKNTDWIQVSPEDRFLHIANISFDPLTYEVWGSLLNGASLIVYPPGRLALAELKEFIAKERITSALFTARLFTLLADEADLESLQGMKEILSGGEAMSLAAAKKLSERLPKCRIVNAYGPTENSVVSTFYPIHPEELKKGATVPIGRPIANSGVYLLDRNRQLVPFGAAGELVCSGDGIAGGYWERNELTSEVFLPDPFSLRSNSKMYLSGDLVRFLSDGNLEYLGRMDNQIKIRGFRIELGEIEETIKHFPKVIDSIVLVIEETPGDKKLVAYVETGKETLNEDDLRSAASKELPGYMVPSFFVLMEKFPVTPNQKIDRKALPSPVVGKKGKAAFKTATEKAIAAIWSKILHVEHIAPDDHFFKLGGDSIHAMQVISHLEKELQIDISIDQLFKYPVLSEFASQTEKGGSSKEKIPKRKVHSPIPLSLNEESLWLLEKFQPGSLAYMLPFAFRIEGTVDVKRLKVSLEKILQRHEALRTRFIEKNGNGLQSIEKQCSDAFIELQLNEKEGLEFIRKQAAVGMDLTQLPLLQIHIIKVQSDLYLVLFRAHHIIFDGWSAGVFFQEWTATQPLPDLPIQYGDFSEWQREFLQTEDAINQLDYWKNQLSGAPELFELPWDKPRLSQFSGKGDCAKLEFSEELSRSLIEAAKQQGVTAFVLLIAAYKVLLYRYSGKEDILIGTPFANRNRAELEPLIGFFVQMLAIRSNITGDFSEFVQQVNLTMSDAYQNGDIPFEKIVYELNPTRNPSYNPVFQVGFGLENIADTSIDLEGAKVKEIALESKVAKFDMHLTMKEVEGKFRCYLEYCTDLFEKQTCQSMLRHFETLLRGIVENPKEKIALIPLMKKVEQRQITVEWNDTTAPYPRDESIPSLFEKIVAELPERAAMRFLGEEMTYRQLNEKSNQFAHYLQEQGVKKGDFVGISLDRSFELIIGLLGILKAGAAYVPIDGAYPAERQEFMIENSGIRAHVKQEMFAAMKTESTENLGLEVGPLDLAYINYTSGSTGRPKGVEVPHRGVIRLIKNSGFFEPTPQDRVLNMASISFDATTAEIWGALLNGACLCIFPQKKLSLDELGTFLVNEKITYGLFTARLFNLLVEQQLSSLKQMKCMASGGEAMSVYHSKIAFEALPNCQLVNAYGPTENSVCTTFYVIHDLSKIEQNVPIGRPINNTTVYVLDANRQPVPVGVHGELYTGGDGLAKGYLKRPDLTDEKFLPNPFGEGKLYQTGDLVKFLPDGNLVYMGRIDNQVKIRGFRIELGEVEDVLRHYEKLADCIAMAREDVPGEKHLVVYVEPKMGENLTKEEINDYAASKLPKYMVPSFFIVLDKFPVTANGKIDRKALPSPIEALESRAFDPPQTPIEQVIADTWSALLKIPKVGRKDHFFHLGGHSIAAAQLSSLVSTEFGVQVPVGLIFEDSILEKYAKQIEKLTMQTDGKQAITTRELFWIWRNRESVLDPMIQPETPAPEPYQYEKPKKIFLTGVTGFVGAFFLKDLIENTDAKIDCHVRAKNEKEGLARIKEVMEKYLLWKPEYEKRIGVVPGDLEKELLGIEAKRFESLAAEIDSIFHIGAFVNHALPYQKLRAANILGTQEALKLSCKTRTKPFHFISTVAAVAIESNIPIKEDIDLRECKDLFNGYAQSKWVGEKLVMIARSRGLPASIYRLARVSGDSRLGSGPTGDFLWRVVQASLRLQMAPQIDYSEDVTPVDYICETLRVISTKPEEINKQFHLLNPQSYCYKDVFNLLKQLGYPLEMTDFQTWRQTLVKTAIDTGEEELRALMPLFAEVDLSQAGDPLSFAYDHVTEALKGTDVNCPKVDEALFKKYIDYYVNTGFLPPYPNG